jgi:diaminopimelate decarboxylase
VVADSFDELERMERLGNEVGHRFPVVLRVTPGIDAHGHEYVNTGHDDSKFGFTMSLGLADAAMERALGIEHVDVLGVHAHIGSQIYGTGPFVANAEVMVALLARWRDRFGVGLEEVNLGGGMAISYTHEDRPVGPSEYGRAILSALAEACSRHEVPVPRLTIEPGRALAGPSTMTVYRVGTIKRLPGIRTYVGIDGGMSDNIRPALYGAEHEAVIAARSSSAGLEAVTVVGKHCESGDVVREHASLPRDLRVGDLIAVAATGAYNESMASNYNRVPRPGAVTVRHGEARLLIERETYEDVVRRDVLR